MRLLLTVALTSLVALTSGRAFADDPKAASTDDLDLVKLLNVKVSTATKTAESLDDAPAIIKVVTREDIHRWGYQSIAEALQHCVGFYVVDDHILPNAGVRGVAGGLGAESGSIKVMIDGRSVAYRTTSGNWLGVELIPLESVKQIEIIRGPASALYGADAFLGVINIITEPPDETRPIRFRGSAGAVGSNAAGQIDLASGHQLGPFDVLVGAAAELGSRSGLALPSQSPAPTLPAYVGERRVANNLDRKSLVLQGRVGYSAPAGRLAVSAYFSALERGGDFAHWAQLTSATDAAGRTLGTVVALEQLRLNVDGLVHASRTVDLAIGSTFFRGGVLPQDRVEVGSSVFYVKRRTSYRGNDTTAEARWTPHERFNVIAGVEGVFDGETLQAPVRYDRNTDAPVLTAGGGDRDVMLTNLGAFISSNLRVVDPWLKLTGGLRYDHHSQYGDQVTGRAAATSRLASTLVAKVMYGTAFKAPSPYLLYATPLRPGDVEGNDQLRPQFIQTVEGQLAWKPSRFFGLSSGLSHSWLADKAEFTPQGINQAARNVASQRSISWETRADVHHYDDVTAYLSSEVIHSVRDLGQEGYAAQLVGTRNVVYPPYILRGGVTFALPSPRQVPLDLGGEAMLIGPRRAADTSIVENGRSFDLDPYVSLNLSLATRALYLVPGQESRVAIRAKNVLGATGPDAGPSGFEYPVAPREIFLELQHVY